MKTIELTVRGTVDSEQALMADVNAEIAGKQAAVASTAQALVAELRKTGVNIQVAALVFAPRAGSHEAPEKIDLNAPEPAPAATETANSGN